MTMTINLTLLVSAFLCFFLSLQVSKIIKLRNKMLQEQKKELEEYTKQLEAFKIVFNDLNKQLLDYKTAFLKYERSLMFSAKIEEIVKQERIKRQQDKENTNHEIFQ